MAIAEGLLLIHTHGCVISGRGVGRRGVLKGRGGGGGGVLKGRGGGVLDGGLVLEQFQCQMHGMRISVPLLPSHAAAI